eukprot:403366875
MENFVQVSSVTSLDFSVNMLKQIETVFLKCPNLSMTQLNASYNLIPESELENVAHICLHLFNLKQLDLYGNEVFNSPAYKFRITENSSLLKLDGLDVQGVIKERLDNLRKDWQINRLIEETSEEAKKWVEAEREIKGMALNILAKKQERLTSEFETYKRKVDEIEMLEDQLRRLEDKRKDALDEVITSTNYLDKLYEISMQEPDVWNLMKKQEYQNSKLDQNRTSNPMTPQKTLSYQGNHRNLDNLMKSGMKSMGNRMRQDLGDEIEQSKLDFDEQARLENAAEQRQFRNSETLKNNGGGSTATKMGPNGSLIAATPQAYENDIGNPNQNSSLRASGVGQGFLDQFKSDNRASQNLNSSGKINKAQPIPIGQNEIQSGAPVQQKNKKDGIKADKQQENPQNKNSKACLIF